jgi:hypothetical protein
MSDPAAEALADDITAAEGVLAERRNTLKLGYTPPAGSCMITLVQTYLLLYYCSILVSLLAPACIERNLNNLIGY